MLTTNRSPRFLFLLFGMLYFVQGVIQSYQLNFFKPHMDRADIDANRLAVVASLALLPFIIKSIYGVISDRINLFGMGHRKPYMIMGVAACAIAFVIAFFVDPSQNFGLVAAMVLTASFFMALFDTTADAYAVDQIPPEDHRLVQSFMTGGRAAGMIILSTVFGFVAARFGFQPIFLIIAACLLIPLVMVFQVQEPAQRPQSHAFQWRAFKSLITPTNIMFAVFLILAWTAFQGIDGLVTFYMQRDLNAGEVALGNWGALKGIGMVVGALFIATTGRRFSHTALAMTTLILVTAGGLALSFIDNVSLILTVAFFWGIVVGFHYTVYATLAMGITDVRIAGTMFAILQTMGNIGIAAGEGLGTSLSDNIGFGGVFRACALLNIVVIPLFLVTIQRLEQKQSAAALGEF